MHLQLINKHFVWMVAAIWMQVTYTWCRKIGIYLKLLMLATVLDCIYIQVNAWWMWSCNTNHRVSSSKPLSWSLIEPAFHPSEVDQMKELLWIQSLRVTCLHIVTVKPWDRWTLRLATTVLACIYIYTDKNRSQVLIIFC